MKIDFTVLVASVLYTCLRYSDSQQVLCTTTSSFFLSFPGESDDGSEHHEA